MQILLALLETSFNQIDLIRHIASSSSVRGSLKNLVDLKLINEKIVLQGITKSKAIFYTLTEKGKDVARLVLKIQERLEAE